MKSDYAAINGLNVYYEIHSANLGPPALVLLHGGGDTIRTSFCNILPELSRNRQVIAFEQQGYGHTSDIADRPFSFELHQRLLFVATGMSCVPSMRCRNFACCHMRNWPCSPEPTTCR